MSKQIANPNNLGTQLAASVSMLLPIIQFFYQWLPDNLSGVFLGKQIFFYVSIITLIISLLVIFWYKSNPFFNFVPFWKKEEQRKYLEYLKQVDPQINKSEDIKNIPVVSPPFAFTSSWLASASIPIVFIFTVLFIWIGISNQSNTQASINLKVFQASLYSLSVIMATFSATHFYFIFENQKDWAWSNQTKIQRTIQLAIENNGLPEFPKVNYVQSWDGSGFPAYFTVQVKVQKKIYNLVTDQRAEVLKGVFRVKENGNT